MARIRSQAWRAERLMQTLLRCIPMLLTRVLLEEREVT